jgi:hypothetical protein
MKEMYRKLDQKDPKLEKEGPSESLDTDKDDRDSGTGSKRQSRCSFSGSTKDDTKKYTQDISPTDKGDIQDNLTPSPAGYVPPAKANRYVTNFLHTVLINLIRSTEEKKHINIEEGKDKKSVSNKVIEGKR